MTLYLIQSDLVGCAYIIGRTVCNTVWLWLVVYLGGLESVQVKNWSYPPRTIPPQIVCQGMILSRWGCDLAILLRLCSSTISRVPPKSYPRSHVWFLAGSISFTYLDSCKQINNTKIIHSKIIPFEINTF